MNIDDQAHDDHGGLHRDLPALLGRRQVLQLMGGAGLAGLLAACGVGRDGASSTTGTAAPTTTAASATTAAPATTAVPAATAGAATTTAAATTESTLADLVASAGAEIPDEAAGPFPADGTNGPNLLTETGVVRTDITASIGPMSGTADGVPAMMHLAIVDADSGAPLPGAAVYLWHCTAAGAYSIYEIEDQNYLRGVVAADDAGLATFATVFPGCYPGRWPHAHFEVYSSLGDATNGSAAIKTSQLALPQAECEGVYADSRYGNSAGNLSRLSLSSDGVFRDGWEDQLAVVSGSADDGLTASLLVRV